MTTYSGERNPRWSGKKYCSVCSKELVTYKERRKKTCSLVCSIKAKVSIGSKHPRWSGVKKCKICENEITGASARKSKTCSPECASKLSSKIRIGAGNPRWQGGTVTCHQCGIEITHSGRLHVKFCSRKCKAKWQSENLSRENSPLWRGGSAYGEYPVEFNAKLRAKIRKRDNYQCRNCSKKQRSLDVHHIDANKQNTSEDNLISLCRSCHRKAHWGRVDFSRILAVMYAS